MSRPLKIAIVMPDNRDEFRHYDDPKPWFGTAPAALLHGLAELPECEVHVVCCIQRALLAPEKLAPNIFYHSEIVPKWGWMRGGYLGCIRSIRRQLAKIQPDIVHGQGTERYCALSAVQSGYPNVLTIHGNMNAIARLHHSRVGSFNWLAARIEDFTLPRSGGIICISEYVRNLVAGAGRPTWLVPNAIQKMFFDFPRATPPPRSRPLLINVGVISERKRQQQVLAMLTTLRAQGLAFDTVFVGVADDAPYPRKFAEMLAQAERDHGGFKHIRKLDDAGFCQLMDEASAMIHFSNEESFGLTFAEAIARGLYLFASDVGAARAIAQGVPDVQIFGLDQWTELQSALQQWLSTPQPPRPPAPPPEFTRTFHPVSVGRRHLEIYREVLGAGPKNQT
jgi:glycosyltransferase involved in cell wall biosynthesis